MLEKRKCSFKACGSNPEEINMPTTAEERKAEMKRLLKKELLNVFQKFGYLESTKDYEVKIKITSGNIAWININCIEIVK